MGGGTVDDVAEDAVADVAKNKCLFENALSAGSGEGCRGCARSEGRAAGAKFVSEGAKVPNVNGFRDEQVRQHPPLRLEDGLRRGELRP